MGWGNPDSLGVVGPSVEGGPSGDVSPFFEFDARFLACFLDVLEEAAGEDHVPVGEVAAWCLRAKESICLQS